MVCGVGRMGWMEGCDSSALDVGRGNAEGGVVFMVRGFALIVWYGGLC